MKQVKTNLLLLIVTVLSFNLSAQELKVKNSFINIQQLPEYIVVTSENTKLLGGIDIIIDYKKSDYADVLEELETLLQNKRKLRIRNQTDLLNAMFKLGFEYVDAYNGTSGAVGVSGGDDLQVSGNQVKYRINMVFRKK